MKVFCYQYDIAWENKQANFKRVEELLAHKTFPAGSLVVLPEMSFTGFSMNVARTSESEPDLTETFLKTTARKFGICLVAGLVTQTPDGRGRNEAVFVTPQSGVTDRYQKLHLFSPAQENSHFTSGDRVVTFECEGGIVAPFICYDLRFPEVFREAVEMKAELFAVIANWPRSRERHWLSLLQARAIENQAFVAGVNRCGKDPNIDYSGRSVIVSPLGEVLADAGEGEAVIEAELDFEAVRKYRCQFPALIDRRRSPASTAESRPEVKKPGSGKLAELQLEQP